MVVTDLLAEGASPAAPGDVLLEARDISKTFPGVKALSSVDFTVRGGEVQALVGENGAGKSTLMKILAGLYQPDSGSIRLGGEEVVLPNTLSAQLRGISVIHQEFFLMPALTVAQNIFFGREPRKAGGLITDDSAINRQAAELLDRLEVGIDPRTPVRLLSVAAQQMVEIAKALSFNSRILIMDEPTAALTESEVATLFKLIRGFVNPDTAVVYISHRMEEIKQIANRITVLRDGGLIASRPAEGLTIPEVIQLMVGRKIATDVRPAPRDQDTPPALEVEGLTAGTLVKDVSFTLGRGEILGFAGLMGAGRTETARAIVGADPKRAGIVKVAGRAAQIGCPADAVRHGIGYLSEDRKRFGLILGQSVAANIALPSLPDFRRSGLLQDGKMRRVAEGFKQTLGIKTPSVHQQVRNLSGGNQQKVVIAKWLARDCDVLIFDEPTRGIDVGAKQEIYDLLHELIGQGKSIIMISSELEEVLRMSDRVAVMCDGRITGILPNAEATQENIMALATQFSAKATKLAKPPETAGAADAPGPSCQTNPTEPAELAGQDLNRGA
ncbi:MAG: sugar ABC transporter ATP-binding protein [Bifidobacteriaceae bacterium]|jgi:ribose transport system ATP-binding protein|nr:sugar ABC transporter ATP-binding protein [Bifidobacteriaceae bacterium]